MELLKRSLAFRLLSDEDEEEIELGDEELEDDEDEEDIDEEGPETDPKEDKGDGGSLDE